MVSILGCYTFDFPKKKEQRKRLEEILQENIDPSYYITPDRIAYLTEKAEGKRRENENV